MGGRDAEELLLSLGEFGSLVSKKLAEVAGDELVVHTTSMMLLCRLDLYGPLRPNHIAELELMTTGGVSRLIDRRSLTVSSRGSVGFSPPTGGLSSWVITRKGRDLVRRLSDEIADWLAETELLVKELNRLLEPVHDLNDYRRPSST